MIEFPKPLHATDSKGAPEENLGAFLPSHQVRAYDEWAHAAGKVRKEKRRWTKSVIRPMEVVAQFTGGRMLDLFESMLRDEAICDLFPQGKKTLDAYRRYREVFLKLRKEKRTTVDVQTIAKALGDTPDAVHKHLRSHRWIPEAFEITITNIGTRRTATQMKDLKSR